MNNATEMVVRRFAVLLVGVAGFVGVLGAPEAAQAASADWTFPGNGNWNDGAKWSPSIPGATTGVDNQDTATFDLDITATSGSWFVNVDPDRNIKNITFDYTSASSAIYGYNLWTGLSGNLRLTEGGVISTASGNDHITRIQVPIQIFDTLDAGGDTSYSFTANSSSVAGLLEINGTVNGSSTGLNVTTLNLNGTNTGANTITGVIGDGAGGGMLGISKTGTGSWTLSGANTFSGGASLGTSGANVGTLILGNNSALGTGLVTARGVQLQSNNNSRTIANDVEIAGGGLRFGGSNDLTFTGNFQNDPGSGFRAIGNHSGSRTLTLDGNFDTNGKDLFFVADNAAASNGSTVVNGDISGVGNIFVDGSYDNGTVTFSGDNTYTGATNVQAGTLLVNGTHTGGADYTVLSGATLGGTGSTNSAISVSGTISPGASIESLGTGDLTFTATGIFDYEINTNTPDADLLYGNIAGTALNIDLGGSSMLNLIELGSDTQLTGGTKFTLIAYDGTWNNGTFDGFADDSWFDFAGNTWKINYNDTTAGTNFFGDATSFGSAFVTITVVPEPEAITLAALGLLGIALLGWRRRRRRNC